MENNNKMGSFLHNTSKYERAIVSFCIVLSFVIVLPATVSAMHISEGYLSPVWCISWGAICIPFVVAGYFAIKKRIKASPKSLILLALCGAFAFVLSALKIPSVTGSCSHPTGVGLGAIMFGPAAMSIIGVIVLLFQAILLAHGGITTLGANSFSMAIVGPFVSFFIYKLSKKLGVSSWISVFLAAFAGNLATYITTSFQLAAAFPDNGSFLTSLVKFLSIFAVTQIPLAICEGLLTVVIFNVVEKHRNAELKALNVI